MGQSQFHSIKTFLEKAPPGLFVGAITEDIRVIGVTAESQKVKPGFIFVAVSGTKSDGHNFAEEALKKGALLIVGERKSGPSPYLKTASARKALAYLAAAFADEPSQKLEIFGITGTSGKTTTSILLESILREAGKKPALMGTIEWRFLGKKISASHTTPGAVELQGFFKDALAAGCKTVVMEVSSHALHQHRTAFVTFDVVGFTNLTHEHLDYHHDMEAYYGAKKVLFTDYLEASLIAGKKPKAVILSKSPFGLRLEKDTAGKFKSPLAVVTNVTSDIHGLRGKINGVEFQSKLIGDFNLENIILAWSMARASGISDKTIAVGIAALEVVPGRLERVHGKKPVHVVVDYAHKPDALEKMLKIMKHLKQDSQKLWVVFGCGGDRDRAKRPVMAKIAAHIADQIVITSDNPRSEDPDAIIREILAGIPVEKKSMVAVEKQRAKAIALAIEQASPGDLIVIAGKGHETTQTIGSEVLPFDDRIEAKKALNSAS